MSDQTQDQIEFLSTLVELSTFSISHARAFVQQAQVRLLMLNDRLNRLNMPMGDSQNPTVGAALLQEIEFINESLTTAFGIMDAIDREGRAVAEQAGLVKSEEETLQKFATLLKTYSNTYKERDVTAIVDELKYGKTNRSSPGA